MENTDGKYVYTQAGIDHLSNGGHIEYPYKYVSINNFSLDNGATIDNNYEVTTTDNFSGDINTQYNLTYRSINKTHSVKLNINKAPVRDDSEDITTFTGIQNEPLIMTLAQLTAGYSDADTLDVENLSANNNATIGGNSTNGYTLTTTQNFIGTITLSYNIVDGKGGSLSVTNNINIFRYNCTYSSSEITSNGDEIIITFNENLNDNIIPSKNAFTVIVAESSSVDREYSINSLKLLILTKLN